MSAETCIVDLLEKLPEEDLYSLSRTVTQGLKKCSNKDEAIQNILKYSPNELSILRRKIITREILFSYLDERNIVIKLPTTKNDLIDKVMELCYPQKSDIKHITQSIEEKEENVIKKYEPLNDGVKCLSEQFSQWFYSMLNESGVIGSEHFFPDSKLLLNIYTEDNCEAINVENDPEEIQNSFTKVKIENNLVFNPNMTEEGVKGKMDPHGLVIILVCGTLHVGNICAGVFEQMFALARDPSSENNWKIKNTKLNLRSKSGVVGPPSLSDSGIYTELLALPGD